MHRLSDGLVLLHHLPARRQNHLVPPLLKQALALLLALRPARRRGLRLGAVLGIDFGAEVVARDQILTVGLGGATAGRGLHRSRGGDGDLRLEGWGGLYCHFIS